MSYITVGKENSRNIDLHYQDFGSGKPAILIHGYPQCGSAWEKQIPAILNSGYRVITYDRRGFGESTKPNEGYNYDTFAADLDRLLNQLDLNDVTLIGHSMGTGEIARYLSRYGSSRVSKAVFIAPTLPYLLKTEENPEGLDKSVFDGFQAAVQKDRYAFLKTFFSNFYSSGLIGHNGVSEEALHHNMAVGAHSSMKAMYDCISTWYTDFRADIPKINVPTMIIQGTGDKVLPIAITGEKLHALIAGSEFVKIKGAPHGLLWTHAEEVNENLIRFLSQARKTRSVA